MQHIRTARARGGFWLTISVCLLCLVLPHLAGAAKNNKIEVCHIPPDDPNNFHTISINPTALDAHLGHGDIAGSCDRVCEQLCDDRNPCTQDTCLEGTLTCVSEADRMPVNCDDGNSATFDFCDGTGCNNQVAVTANDIEASTNGAASIDIELQGNSLFGDASLTFEIVSGSGPSAGTIGSVTPIVPDPFSACSESGLSCTSASDCPATETCDTLQPPVTSATVTYTPNDTSSNLADGFQYTAALASDATVVSAPATVSINPPPEAPAAPPQIANVTAVPVSVETQQGVPVDILLKGDAPDTISTLTISITAPPSNGSVSTPVVNPAPLVRTATVTYTPDAFTGTDSFTFEVCDAASTSNCDAATVTVEVLEPISLTSTRQVATLKNQPVTVDFANVRFIGATVAGTVVGSNGTGNSTDDTSPLAAAAKATANDVDVITRFHIEWDISSLQQELQTLESADVVLRTEKGSNDSLDTVFFSGLQDQDGQLTPDDFQAPASLVFTDTSVSGPPPPVVMPVQSVADGTTGIFSFSVRTQLSPFLNGFCSGTGLTCSSNADCSTEQTCNLRHYFSIQGRLQDESQTGQGLQIRTAATDNLTSGLEPQLKVPGVPPIVTIVGLPTHGTLLDASDATLAVNVPTITPSVTYKPDSGFFGSDSFTYRIGTNTVLVNVDVDESDGCAETGRGAGCVPTN